MLPPITMGWSFSNLFKKLVDDSYDDCLQSHTGFTSNYKEYCDNGKQLIEDCDFDEDFDCGGETDELGDISFDRKRRSLLSDGTAFLNDYVNAKKDQLIDYSVDKKDRLFKYAENKTLRIIEKTKNYTSRVMNKVRKYKHLFFSSSSFYELGKAYTQNCNDKVKEYFGTFRTDSKREYVVKIICNKKGSNQTKPYISELKTKGCVYIPKNMRNKTGQCPQSSTKTCTKQDQNALCAYDYACPSAQKCCSNGCDKTKVCMNPVNKKPFGQVKETTISHTSLVKTTEKYNGKVCLKKSKFRGYLNCLFKRKQCSSDNDCPEDTACCSTGCGRECLRLVLPSFRDH